MVFLGLVPMQITKPNTKNLIKSYSFPIFRIGRQRRFNSYETLAPGPGAYEANEVVIKSGS